jgi:hypothetical protein
MVEFMRAGGWPMWVVLIYSLVALVAAALFAARPEEGKLAFIRAMSAATVFAVLGGVASCIGAVMANIPNNPEFQSHPQIHLIVMVGIGESCAPAILGFVMLSLVWVITAAGVRRLAQAS